MEISQGSGIFLIRLEREGPAQLELSAPGDLTISLDDEPQGSELELGPGKHRLLIQLQGEGFLKISPGLPPKFSMKQQLIEQRVKLLKHPRESLQALQALLPFAPERADLQRVLGEALFLLGEEEGAIKHWERSLALAPNLQLSRWLERVKPREISSPPSLQAILAEAPPLDPQVPIRRLLEWTDWSWQGAQVERERLVIYRLEDPAALSKLPEGKQLQPDGRPVEGRALQAGDLIRFSERAQQPSAHLKGSESSAGLGPVHRWQLRLLLPKGLRLYHSARGLQGPEQRGLSAQRLWIWRGEGSLRFARAPFTEEQTSSLKISHAPFKSPPVWRLELEALLQREDRLSASARRRLLKLLSCEAGQAERALALEMGPQGALTAWMLAFPDAEARLRAQSLQAGPEGALLLKLLNDPPQIEGPVQQPWARWLSRRGGEGVQQAAERWVEECSQAPEAYLALAEALLEHEELGLGRRALYQALHLRPQHPRALIMLFDSFQEPNLDEESALKALDRAQGVQLSALALKRLDLLLRLDLPLEAAHLLRSMEDLPELELRRRQLQQRLQSF